MLSILLGPNDFSKTEYINSLALKEKAEVEFFLDAENVPPVSNLAGQDLFSKPKVYVLKGLVKSFSADGVVEKLIASKNQIVIVEEKLDKRLSENKGLLSNSKIAIKQFNLPHGRELNEWIADRVKALNGSISLAGVESLAVALGRDDAKETKFGGKVTSVEEIYNLWQADSEVKKLVAFANGGEITENDVSHLVFQNGEVDVFDLTNAIADNQKQKALELMAKFLKAQTGSDEKGSIIQLNALLSEQFRNVAMVQDFINRKTSEDNILEQTGWKSGRLFIIKKIAGRFPAKTVLEFLNKLQALDDELKTSSTPPKVLLDLIVSQLLV
ncbi:MAG TPA: hypothetical protein VE973_01520 [Candidatus Limnocylindria bacterium]|nr:hypothetical protein [Candidatus Limnocylindria bacterium]